jgi:N,N'-diacetyllegionaminate synthase
MKKTIKIRDRVISAEQPVFIIAETGVTCNYDMTISKELIEVVKESGADAIKFILWFPEEIMSDKSIVYTYETLEGTKSENMYEMLNKLKFSLDQWQELKQYADQKGVILFATVNSPSGIEYAETIGLEAYKLSSWDFNYFPLWRKIAALGKPMLIDTGPVNTLELAKVMQLMKDAGNDQSVLVHCFHTENYAEMNMRSIPYMRQAFDTLVGFSASDWRDEMDIMALSLGAVVLEKRLSLSRGLPGHHHVLSKEPKEFIEYVKLMRQIQSALGGYDLRPSPGDLAIRRIGFRQIVANRDIPQGTSLTADMLEGKRPESGISPEYLDFFVGRVTKRDLKYNEALTWDCV